MYIVYHSILKLNLIDPRCTNLKKIIPYDFVLDVLFGGWKEFVCKRELLYLWEYDVRAKEYKFRNSFDYLFEKISSITSEFHRTESKRETS